MEQKDREVFLLFYWLYSFLPGLFYGCVCRSGPLWHTEAGTASQYAYA
jgi:hypothetical protein